MGPKKYGGLLQKLQGGKKKNVWKPLLQLDNGFLMRQKSDEINLEIIKRSV